ncbi:hypothetical protein D3C76_1261980 [compost metagenome]
MRTKLFGGLSQLGLRHVGIEILDPGLHRRLRFVSPLLAGQLLLAAFYHRRLFPVALGLGALALLRIGFAVAGLEIERALLQAGEGIAVDAPGGDPAQLCTQGLFQAVVGG